MGMTGFYGPTDDAESARTLRYALDAGITLFDTADRYGLGRNEELVGRALAGTAARIATKFGIVQGRTPGERLLDGSPAYVRRACEASLGRLGRSTIDLYLLHRVDKKVPIEETVGAMGQLVAEGKVRYIGLCEVSAASLRRAHATFPISAVQSEYSLWCREPEVEVLGACRELGIGFMAYWALGIGMLTARFTSPDDFVPGDFRPSTPRFQPAHFARNLELVTKLGAVASRAGCTPAQLALAWLLARAPNVVPLIGTKKVPHLEENLRAASVSLDGSVLAELEQVFPSGAGSGDRYPPDGMAWLNG
jgi:aryl-alcohol dehydrogenase-like predicted oxidoreductase